MSERIFEKYRIECVNGKPVEGGWCLVMEFGDLHGRAGIRAFRDSIKAAGYDKLAKKIDDALAEYDEPLTISVPASQPIGNGVRKRDFEDEGEGEEINKDTEEALAELLWWRETGISLF